MQINTSDRKEQRKFGIVMAVAIALLGLVRWGVFHGGRPAAFFYVAGAFLVLGLIFPRALQPVFWAWIRFSLALNWIMTRVLLTLAFFGMIVPTRIILKLRGSDPLKRAWEPDSQSYWEEPEEQPKELERYFNQF